MRVLARPRFLRGDDDLGYLLRVLRNTHVSRLRAAGRRPVGVPFPEDAPEPEDVREAWRPETSIEVDLLFTVIASLSEPFREALVAVDIAGLSYGEAGEGPEGGGGAITTPRHPGRQQGARPPPRAGQQGGREPGRASRSPTRCSARNIRWPGSLGPRKAS